MRALTLSIVLALACTAFAQNPHFTSGPTTTRTSTSLTSCATIAGLGSTPTDVSLSCQDVSFQCVNRQGHVDNAHETLTATKQFTPHNGTIKNACVTIAATCPHGQAGPFNVQFSNCTYSVSQNGTVVLQESLGNF